MMGNFSRFMYDGGFGGTGWEFGALGVAGGMVVGFVMLLIVIWTLYWKFHALWYAAKHDEKWWFIAFLVINTLGILEILYLYYFSKKVPAGHDEKNVPMVTPQS